MRLVDPYTREPPHPCERLAKVEGEAAWFKNLAGIEEATDMTEPMAALSFGRAFSSEPMEVLEVKWGGARLYVRAMTYHVLGQIEAISKKAIKPSDRAWMVAAVRDAVELVRGEKSRGRRASVVPIRERAKQFRVDHDAYAAVRIFAQGLVESSAGTAEPAYVRAMYRDR